jgi:hypothetical protein
MEELLDQDQVRKLLRCSQSHLDRERRAGRLPCIRIGRKVLYAPDDVRRFIESHRCVTGGV